MGVYTPPSAISSATDNLADLLAQSCNSEMLVLGDDLNLLDNKLFKPSKRDMCQSQSDHS